MEVTDPFTGKKSLITIDRTGTHEQKLIVALANPKLKQEQKDQVLSMYLFERGKESASFITDLMAYKGQYTKEGRVFQSRMRYDFEAFVGSFTRYLENQSRLLGITLGVDIAEEKTKFEAWLKLPNNKEKNYSYKDFNHSADVSRVALIELALYAFDEAKALREVIQRIVQAREAQKGGGIYVNQQGRPYSVNDPNLDEIIKADRQLQQEAE